jgi:ribonuclease HII
MKPTFREEKKLWGKGIKRVVCLDEAGRGALCGPVVAAAVMLNSKFKIQNITPHQNLVEGKIQNLRDSKKLTAKQREEWYKILTKNPQIKWGIGIVSKKIIDKINIKNAAELAMEKALKDLERKMKKKADFLIIDGNHINSKNLKARSYKLIVKADEKVFSCAVASIIAKVTRDKIMEKYAKKYSKYGFEIHKGYPTKFHLKMLKKYGPCKIHRKSFSPVKICYNNKKRSKKIIKQRAIEQRTIWRKNQFIWQ